MRHLYLVLSPRSLPYARHALESLFRNAADPFDLRLITDSAADKAAICEAVAACDSRTAHRWTVFDEDELADHEAARFAPYPHLRAFRHGHPCWRKITDPLLLSDPAGELVILDPDLYFPNRFRFEETPRDGVLLMWQKPNCLVPPEVVGAAMSRRILLADHVDIGVAHWRASADLDWLNWLIGSLGGANLPRAMHVEAIVWSAIAMRFGGGYLDPAYWRCWHYTQTRRAMRRLGASGDRILASEPWRKIKCFHAGGEAKWWLADAKKQSAPDCTLEYAAPARTVPFVELTPAQYNRGLVLKRWLRRLGYYRLFHLG